MKRKRILILGIILAVIALIVLGIDVYISCSRKPTSVSTTPAETPEEIEIEKRLGWKT